MYSILSKQKVRINLFKEEMDYIIYKDINVVYRGTQIHLSMNAYSLSNNNIIPELSVSISYNKDQINSLTNHIFINNLDKGLDFADLVNLVHIETIKDTIVKEGLFGLNLEDWEIK